MANLIIPPRDLPAVEEVFPTDALVVDNGASVGKATPQQVVDAGRPWATVQQGQAGLLADVAMSPLATAAAIEAQVGDVAAEAATEAANTAVETAVRPFLVFPTYAEAMQGANSLPPEILAVSARVSGYEARWIRTPGGDCLGGGWAPAGEATFAHYGGRPPRSDQSRATIKHKRTGGLIYDVATVLDPRPETLAPRVVDGTTPGTGVSGRISARDFAAQKNIPGLMNFNAFRNADGSSGWDAASLVPNGFLIVDQIVYASWASSTNTARVQGFTVQRDGTMVRRVRGAGDAAGYVADDAVWGTSWGCWLVWDGADVSAQATFMENVPSARTILGQRANGDWVMIAAQGISGDHGPDIPQSASIALAEGCVSAFLLEGGGSTQLWWDHYYACPSSENSWQDERTLPSFLAIDCPLQEYDTGLIDLPLEAPFTAYSNIGVKVRQSGAQVSLQVGINGAFTDTPVAVTPIINTAIRRFRPENGNASARGFLSGSAGIPGMCYLANSLTLRTLAGGAPGYLAGSVNWMIAKAPNNT